MQLNKMILPAQAKSILQKDGWYIWGASVCKHADKYYIFAAGWEKKYTFQGWVAHSTVLRGVAECPEGPFSFLGEMQELKTQAWSSEVLHNPTVHQIGDKYYLFYIGTHLAHDARTNSLPNHFEKYRYHQKIGMAVSDHPAQAFTPCEKNPIFDIDETSWDNTFVTNPALCIEPSGVHLIYKALIKASLPDIVMKLGVATAKSAAGPFTRILHAPILAYNIEDPFIWKQGEQYYMIAKDMTGALGGAADEATLFVSRDCTKWEASSHPFAYGTEVLWEDGSTVRYHNVERPQIYFENGIPICLYNAVRTFDGDCFNLARRIQNV